MRTRDQIIKSMCLTWRHDYGLQKHNLSGMSEEEKNVLYGRMAQIFDNDIAPHMEFKKDLRKTELVHDGIIKIHSFEFTEREKKGIAMGLKYGPAAAAMKDDGSFFESFDPPTPKKRSWKDWFLKKRSWKHWFLKLFGC